MFFSKPGEYEACKLFSVGQLILIILTLTGIIIALKKTIHKNKNEIRKIIKTITIITWILETIKIGFNLYIGGVKDVNNYIPLYYCSLFLYAGTMSSFGKGKIERMGDVFLATGGIAGGIVFIILPTTSLSTYPTLHYLSLYSFFYHGAMIYLGVLINITHYINIQLKDILYYGCLVGVICVIALIVNNIFDSNLMFISKDFPETPITIMYHLTGIFFTPIMIFAQMTVPFFCIYLIKSNFNKDF